MKTNIYKEKQRFTQQRKDSLKKYGRDKVLEQYQTEINNGKGNYLKRQDYTIISNMTMNIDKPFKEITSNDLLDYFSKMENGVILNYHRKRYSPYTIEQHKVQICKFFKWLCQWESWQPLPEVIRKININLSRAYKFKDLSEIPSIDDIEKLIETCEQSKNPFLVIRDKALISTFYSGGRLEEIYNLKVSDVINQNGNILLTLDGKTGRRTVCINRYSCYLKKYFSIHPQNNNPNSPLWLNQYGKELKYTAIRGRFVLLHKSSGLKHFSPHDLRHRRATDLVEMGLSESEQRLLMGWSNSSKTPSKYTHLSGVKVLNKLIQLESDVLDDEVDIEYKVEQRLAEEKEKMQDEILRNLINELKNPQHHIIQNFLYEQSEKS
ncbi:MAG: tyrosine-type recombinase/integrase [Candidatus Thermoplasmatota archaeon]|nr:tyrosine-type recombinase/integrase [Candidatus Thermoplasmatota archaeon]